MQTGFFFAYSFWLTKTLTYQEWFISLSIIIHYFQPAPMNEMPLNIGDYSQVEYLTVFNTIIFGVVAAEYFSGWGAMIRHRNTIKVYWVHIAWTVFAFMTLIQNWYGIWPRTAYINNGILYFYYSMVPMLVFHFITVILFPGSRKSDKVNFSDFYKKNARALFIMFGIYLVITIISSQVYEDRGDVVAQNIIRAGGVIICSLGAIFSKRIWIHIIFLVIGFIGLFQFLFVLPK